MLAVASGLAARALWTADAAWPLPEEEQETWTEKAVRKFKQNPGVVLGAWGAHPGRRSCSSASAGCLATAGAFTMASVQFKRGKQVPLPVCY